LLALRQAAALYDDYQTHAEACDQEVALILEQLAARTQPTHEVFAAAETQDPTTQRKEI